MADLGEVDLGQVILNLLTITSHRELCTKFDITMEELNSLPRLFSIGSALVDLHYDCLPELHTKKLLLISEGTGKWSTNGGKR